MKNKNIVQLHRHFQLLQLFVSYFLHQLNFNSIESEREKKKEKKYKKN